MKFYILAVGRGMPAPIRDLVVDYQKRLERLAPVELIEVAETRRDPMQKGDLRALAQEGERLRRLLPKGAMMVPLASNGRTFSSMELANEVRRMREEATREVFFVIGGPDGLDQTLLAMGSWRLSLGAMTFPHMLVRVMLLEQLYRAMTILGGIPYHR
ncbi:MAG: 23S rRNA (pseudouridine(1915)-N(3))-methyltransferase RlmH [Magnetococcales bacterium]|nr:23S rRNA (pseudouridine(1915)-N(3))-methyltransferase RlmH [Magnetococcales bacterium]